jgi:hypothetical protein
LHSLFIDKHWNRKTAEASYTAGVSVAVQKYYEATSQNSRSDRGTVSIGWIAENEEYSYVKVFLDKNVYD